MGDRVSISFRKGNDESVALFSHWGGMGFVEEAREYAMRLKEERSGHMYPLDRFEPDTVMVDFIRHITRSMKRVESDLYLGKTSADGDNGDNGHHVVEL
jgi:hypothetical protein